MTSTRTPARAVRIPDGLWLAAQKAAAEQGETVSDVIRDALERYVGRHQASTHKVPSTN